MLLTLFPVFYAFCNPFDINDLETAFKTVLICLFNMYIFAKSLTPSPLPQRGAFSLFFAHVSM